MQIVVFILMLASFFATAIAYKKRYKHQWLLALISAGFAVLSFSMAIAAMFGVELV